MKKAGGVHCEKGLGLDFYNRHSIGTDYMQ